MTQKELFIKLAEFLEVSPLEIIEDDKWII